jgi:hypothetical protein
MDRGNRDNKGGLLSRNADKDASGRLWHLPRPHAGLISVRKLDAGTLDRRSTHSYRLATTSGFTAVVVTQAACSR